MSEEKRKSIFRTIVKIAAGAALLVAIAVTILLAEYGPKTAAMAVRWSCPCVYSEGRTLEYCIANAPMGIGDLSRGKLDNERRSIEVTSFLLFTARGRHEPGRGCVIETGI